MQIKIDFQLTEACFLRLLSLASFSTALIHLLAP